MCDLSGQGARNAQTEARRDAAALASQQEAAYQQMLAQIPEAPKPTPPPSSVRGTLDDTNSGVRTAQSKRKSALNMNKGAAALRIPLNIGESGGSGLNLG